MGGNLQEWTEGEGLGGATTRVVRGGAWFFPSGLRASDSFDNLPATGDVDFGFRIARSVP